MNDKPEQVGGSSRVRSRVFLSYSHSDRDRPWFGEIQRYLLQLNVAEDIELWDDRRIQPGDDWLNEIEENLEQAMAAVLVITPGYITSEFISNSEVPALLARNVEEGLILHALVAQPTNWHGHEIEPFLETVQRVHPLEMPLEAMSEAQLHDCLHRLVSRIKDQVGMHRGRNSAAQRNTLMQRVARLVDVELEEEVAGGDTTIVYRARRGGKPLAVKAMVSHYVSDSGQREFREEYRRCHDLRSPVFIRIYDLDVDDCLPVITADWVSGRSLKNLMRSGSWRDGPVRWQRVFGILHKLAAALAEGQERRLRYLNISPAHVMLCGDEPKIYPIDFSAWLARVSYNLGALSFTLELLEYIAPEYLARPVGPMNLSLAAEERERLEWEHIERSRQYTLGMLALALLAGGPPVPLSSVADISHLARFHQNPRRFRGDGKQRLRDSSWCRAHPGLARVIWRMLAPAPEQRWDSMAQVVEQLNNLASSFSTAAGHVSEAKCHYLGALKDNEAFYSRFYRILFELAPDVQPLFRDVDMAGQRRQLDAAVERLLNFRPNQAEPTTLSDIADRHRGMGLEARHFECFGKAFMRALKETEGQSRDLRDAWGAVLWPGIDYLRDQVTTPDDRIDGAE